MAEQKYARSDIPVTISVIRKAKPGSEEQLEECISGIVEAAMKFPGHLGTSVFRSVSPDEHEYRIVYKFDHLSHLRQWEASEEQLKWSTRMLAFQQQEPETQVTTGLEAWFTVPGQQKSAPPRYKTALLTWLAAFPIVTILYLLFGSFLTSLHFVLRALLLTAILIALLNWIVMLLLTHLFIGWLYPKRRQI